MNPSFTIAVSIDRAPTEVAAFVADVTQLPRWAAGLCRSARRQGSEWRLETDQGEVGFRFTGNTEEGILDHVVTLPDGAQVRMPLRVVPNEAGSEVLFTLFQPPDMSDERLQQDMALMRADLEQLKQVLEGADMSPP